MRGAPPEQTLALLHNQYLTDGKPRTAFRHGNLYAGPVVVNRDEAPRYVYWHRRLPHLGEERLRILWTRMPRNFLLSAVLTTFPVCFALAWYLSGPIRRLQQATREFSSTRKVPENIGPLLGRGDEFGDLAREFSRMAGRVQQTLESQRQLLSDVSHELRSPLARLRVALGLAERKPGSDPAYRRELDQMVLECERMDALIGRLLELARLESGAADTETTAFDLCELLRDIKRDTELEARQKNVTLRESLPGSLVMEGVPELLRAAVENVLRNAVRHAPENSEVQIQLSTKDGRRLLSVTDRGPGVSKTQLEKIFEPFYRPQYARERNTGGSGLGLAIARRAVEHHGGRIWAENVADGGLRISIGLPADTGGSRPS